MAAARALGVRLTGLGGFVSSAPSRSWERRTTGFQLMKGLLGLLIREKGCIGGPGKLLGLVEDVVEGIFQFALVVGHLGNPHVLGAGEGHLDMHPDVDLVHGVGGDVEAAGQGLNEAGEGDGRLVEPGPLEVDAVQVGELAAGGVDQVAQSELPQGRPGERIIPEPDDGIRDPAAVVGHGGDEPGQDGGVGGHS